MKKSILIPVFCIFLSVCLLLSSSDTAWAQNVADLSSEFPDLSFDTELPLENTGGSSVTELENGLDVGIASVSNISSACRDFTFALNDGDFAEQTSAVPRPSGAGFITFINRFSHAFVSSSGSTTLTERPLGQIYFDVGLRGDNLVAQVRLTDSNADDPVRIRTTACVLFWE